ncbi:MAG: tRNA (guanine-N7)-methyltransferase [Myxococcales bacterium]|nr:tRNA (guanine-N7)-methyltransferase [Myxococcales bacterium]
MPRLRGPIATRPEGDAAWALLNGDLFGDAAIGGYRPEVRPEVLPLDWAQIFGRVAPLNLEIGFNRGRFLRSVATARPDEDFIGVEVRRKFCWRLANLLGADPAAPRNLRLIWADARRVTESLLAPGSLHGIYINFPDPWWKRRHVSRRLVNLDFAKTLTGLLAPDGAIHVKSDVPAIADEIAEALAAMPELASPVPFSADDLPPSHRETVCMRQGLPIVRYRVARRG